MTRHGGTTTFSDHGDVDRVRQSTDLVRLIGEHVALTRKGREHVGLCPFHDDRRPSMAVVTHKGDGFFKCFACGEGGDCFDFVQKYHKMDFREALHYLADRAGVDLTPRQSADRGTGASGDGSGGGSPRADLLKANDFAQRFFREQLLGAGGDPARAILERRGISEAMSEAFQIGYAPPGYDAFLSKLNGRPGSIRTATDAGLLRARENGGHYDTFRNRLIFPICDDVGRPVAFGGRIIDPEDNPKYLNSPESAVFHKSRTLYGLHRARRAIIDHGEAIVTEGYTDVIACHQAGIENVVGTLGTALTIEHATKLARICDTVILLFDGDEAGQRAADRGVEVFFAEPVDVRICVLPDGQDPDEMLGHPDGQARFRAALDGAIDALDYKVSRFRRTLDGTQGLSAQQKQLEGFLQELADLGVQRIDGVRRTMVLTQLADLLQLTLAQLESALAARRARPATTRPAVTDSDEMHDEDGAAATAMFEFDGAGFAPVSRARRVAERSVLAALLADDADPAHVEPPLGAAEFIDGAAREVAHALIDDGGHAGSIAAVLPGLTPPASRLASDLVFESREREADETFTLATTVADLRALAAREAHLNGVERFRRTGDASDADRVAAQILQRRQQGDLPSAIIRGVRGTAPVTRPPHSP